MSGAAREPEPLQQVGRTQVRFQGRNFAYFAGCDYFRLARHPRVLAAVARSLREFGLNVAASRMTTGNHRLYRQLETRLAEYFEAQDAILMPTGYVTNLAVGQALAGTFSHALLDARSHPTLQDAARFLDCPVLKFVHRSAADLAKAAERCGPGAKLIVLTDGMFSHDGSAAPLREYRVVLPKDAVILVDDAHGAGVLGGTGRGTLEHAGVTRRNVIQTLTFSKAFGTYGGAILGTRTLRRRVLTRGGLFVGSTPLPLPLAGATLESLELLDRSPALRDALSRNARFVKDSLRANGFPVPDHPGPIVALYPRTRRTALELKEALLKAGIFPPFIRYPGGPEAGYFRFVLCSEHQPGELRRLLAVLKAFPASKFQP